MTTTDDPDLAVPERMVPARGSLLPAVATLAVVLVTAVHLLVCALVGVDALEPYGLIHSMPVTFWPAVAAGAVGLVLLLRDRERPFLLGTVVVALTTTLHGSAAFLEPVARFPTAWLHAGYTQYVLDNHAVLPELGARFSWPGFFVTAATAIDPLSDRVPELFLRWAPLAFTLAYIPPILVIARRLLPGWRAPWLTVAVFAAVNWVGQDYFAPQSMAFLLGLMVIAVALTWFTGPRRLWSITASGILRPRGLFRPPGPFPDAPPVRIALVLAVSVIIAALAVSHQLTLYVIALQLLAIWAVRRGRVLLISLIAGLMAMLWLSWGAIDFWLPWFGDVFGDIGDPGGNLGSALAERMLGSSDHLMVAGIRIAFTLALLALAALGLIRQHRVRGGVEPTIPLLICSAFALLLVQSYGGEGLLRAFLYASPFVAAAIACAFVPARALSFRSAAAFVAAFLLASPVFLIARYGNESFERVEASEVALAECLYETAPPGATLVAISPHLAWQFRDIDLHPHVYENGVRFDGQDVDDFIGQGPAGAPRYLILTEPQLRFVERFLGAPAGWGDAITARFAADPRWDAVCTGPGGVVYEFVPTGGGAR